jgi:hypothetical protein
MPALLQPSPLRGNGCRQPAASSGQRETWISAEPAETMRVGSRLIVADARVESRAVLAQPNPTTRAPERTNVVTWTRLNVNRHRSRVR